jgi:hypothetical protein
VCAVPSAFVQETVVPAATVTSEGTKTKFAIRSLTRLPAPPVPEPATAADGAVPPFPGELSVSPDHQRCSERRHDRDHERWDDLRPIGERFAHQGFYGAGSPLDHRSPTTLCETTDDPRPHSFAR